MLFFSEHLPVSCHRLWRGMKVHTHINEKWEGQKNEAPVKVENVLSYVFLMPPSTGQGRLMLRLLKAELLPWHDPSPPKGIHRLSEPVSLLCFCYSLHPLSPLAISPSALVWQGHPKKNPNKQKKEKQIADI